jgi:hypothetical protein
MDDGGEVRVSMNNKVKGGSEFIRNLSSPTGDAEKRKISEHFHK